MLAGATFGQLVVFAAAAVCIAGGIAALLFHFFWYDALRRYQQIRAKAEQSLQQAASIIDNSEDAIIAKTLGGIVTSWNRAAEKIYGYGSHEMIGHSIDALIPDDRSEELAGILRKISAGERLEQYETVRVRRDGQRIDVSLTISPMFDPEGKIVGASTIARDITPRKILERQQAEQAELVARSNEQLARRQRVMVSLLEDLHESKNKLEDQKRSLQEANERLASLNAMKDEFVATASHELRTPLTAIREGISLLRDRVLGPINDEQNEFLTTVDENIDRLTELISNILDLSKIEAGRFSLFRRRLDLAERIRALLRENRKLAGKRTLEADLPDLPEVWADANRVSQVLWNFFSNALKFTGETGRIRFSLKREGGQVFVSVQDDGVGIAPEDIPKLFQRFSQVGQKCYRGTGLGLALCKQIVELHKGTISVSSEPGRGSTFTFSLPVYSKEWILEEYFNEQFELARQNGSGKVGLAVFESLPAALVTNGSAPHSPEEQAERTIELLRPHFLTKDSVFAAEPGWVVVLAAVDEEGLKDMVERLSQVFADQAAKAGYKGPAVRHGSALYPRAAPDAQALFRAASAAFAPGEVSDARR